MIPSWLQAIVLGIVQGLTEFIPVSSSGHLVLVPYLLSWERPGLAFDVALHLGTAAAVVVYFRQELAGMALAAVRQPDTAEGHMHRRMLWLLAVATVPVGVVGILARDAVGEAFEIPQVAATFLLVTAAALWAGEWFRGRRVEAARAGAHASRDDEPAWTGSWIGDLTDDDTAGVPASVSGTDPEDPDGLDLRRVGLREALIVGFAQILALLPGMSRSGTTITAGLFAGMTRTAATRFSFLLALPAMVGAFVVSAGDLAEPGPYAVVDILLGVAAAFFAGWFAIAFLIRLVSRVGLTVFVRYLVAASAIGWFGYVVLGPISSV